MNTDHVSKSSKCTGCYACFSVCPAKAVSMTQNKEGFWQPEVHEDRCIHCGKCKQVCIISQRLEPTRILKVGSFRGEDSVRKKSSSGGLFYYLAQETIKDGGVVFGAAFDADEKLVRHMCTDDISLESIQRSKYVQSKIGDSYRRVKMVLMSDRRVLFCGTPCQVFGLQRYLGKEYPNLLTVDFVCHGVPSPMLLKDLIEWHERREKSNISNMTFREKKLGWRTQMMCMYFKNGHIFEKRSKETLYYNGFLDNITLRESCYSCQLPSAHSSDITFYDYWAVKDDDDKGVSAYIIHTDKGMKAIQTLEKHGWTNDPSIEESHHISIPHDRIRTYKRKALRDQFFSCYSQRGFEYAYFTCLPRLINRLKFESAFWSMGARAKHLIQGMVRK